MKNKKVLIIIILVSIVVITGVICGFLYYKSTEKDQLDDKQLSKTSKETTENEQQEKELEAKNVYAGTYKNCNGITETITINENGDLYYKDYKIDIDKKDENLGIIVYDKHFENGIDRCMIWPVDFQGYGLGDGSNTDKSKIRLVLHGGGGTLGQEGVYYKVD